jgi:hypothetical protein
MKIENPTLFPADALPLIGPVGESLLTVIVKGTFAFDQGHSELADRQLPIAYGDAYRDGSDGVYYESDIVPFKKRTDIVLDAVAFAPDEAPAETVPVTVKVGSKERRLIVFGERFWNHAGVLSRGYVMTAAKPFVRRSISYEDAFGGIDEESGAFCVENLAGKGMYSRKPKQNLAGKPLPCIEDPRDLIRNVGDRPRPVGLGFYSRSWQPRAGYAGTYDRAWREGRCPLPPRDFDPLFYNGAHPDLQMDGCLKGDEPVFLQNLTPEGETAFQLPGIRFFCRIERRGDNRGGKEKTHSMNPDTLFIETERQRYCIVWRAAVEVEDPSAVEVERVTIVLKQT